MPSINVTKLSHFSGHQHAIYSLCKGIGEHEFYSGGSDGLVVSWNYLKKEDGKLLVQVNRPVYSLCLNRDRQMLYCGTASGNLHVIDLASGKEIRNIEAHALGIFDIRIVGAQLITSGGDGHLRVWNLDDFTLLHHIRASDKSARCISVSNNNRLMAVGFSDHSIRVYALPSYELVKKIDAHENSVFSVAFTPDDMELLSGGRDATLRSWNVNEDYTCELNIPAHTLHINHICFNEAGNLFATLSMDKHIKIWETSRIHLLKVIDKPRNNGHQSSVNKGLWLGNNKLLTCSDDRSIILWNIEWVE